MSKDWTDKTTALKVLTWFQLALNETTGEPFPCRGVQPAAHGPHAAQDGYECGPTQNHKFT